MHWSGDQVFWQYFWDIDLDLIMVQDQLLVDHMLHMVLDHSDPEEYFKSTLYAPESYLKCTLLQEHVAIMLLEQCAFK